MRRLPVGLVLLAALLSCAHHYGLDRQRRGAAALAGPAVAYVALPEPGRLETRVYADSGRQTQAAIAAAIGPRVAKAELGTSPEDQDTAVISARNRGATRAIVAKIERWEDRATEWSGKPDRIVIDIRIVDVGTGQVLDAAEVSGTSRWATFGGDHPQDLLPRAIGDYVNALFQ